MKICYVANSRFPSERAHMTQIVQMCNAFAKIGHEVTLLVTNRKTTISEGPESYFGVPLKFKVVRISVPDVAGASERIPILLRPFIFMLQRIIFARGALDYIRKIETQLIYGRDEWILWLLSLSFRGSMIWESHEAKYSYAARRLVAKLHKIVVISEGIRDYYVRRGLSREILHVAHDAVDSRFFESHISQKDARMLLGIDTKKPVVMYVGGLEKWKGADTLFEASKDTAEFETYVIGGKKSELEEVQKKYPHVHFLGPRPYRDLPTVQQAADILIIPNTATTPLAAEYTSPLKLFSYMTSKKPIIASRIPSITNVVRDDMAYFFVPDDAQSLQKMIRIALGDPGSGVRAERSFEESKKYTWDARALGILPTQS